MIWLRLYTTVRHNRRLQTMSAEDFRTLVNLWTLAKDHNAGGSLPPIEDIAFELRISEEQAKEILSRLASDGYVTDSKKGRHAITNWEKWQSRDDSKNRMQRHRLRKSDGSGDGSGDGTSDDSGYAGDAHRVEQSRVEQKNTHTTREKKPDFEPFDGLDVDNLVDKTINIVADFWPNVGDVPMAKQVWKRHAVEDVAGPEQWCSAVVITAKAHSAAHIELKRQDAKHFIPHLMRWVSSGDYSRKPPAVIRSTPRSGPRDIGDSHAG